IFLCAGDGDADEKPLVGEPRGVFVGEDWRYQHHSVLGGFALRTLADLVAMPAGIIGWDWKDWLAASLVVATTVTFEIPLNPSIDVRLQRSSQQSLGANHLELWTKYGDTVMWLTVFGAIGGTLAY